jgi:hypothetical protein
VIVTSPNDGAGAKAVETATVVNDDGIGDVAFDRWPARAPRETMEFTEPKLKDLLKGGRPQRQSVTWDTKATGLSVLISRGPKEKRQATLSLRVVYCLKDHPSKPRYKWLGKYPRDFPTSTSTMCA